MQIRVSSLIHDGVLCYTDFEQFVPPQFAIITWLMRSMDFCDINKVVRWRRRFMDFNRDWQR